MKKGEHDWTIQDGFWRMAKIGKTYDTPCMRRARNIMKNDPDGLHELSKVGPVQMGDRQSEEHQCGEIEEVLHIFGYR
jgi:hypothetical protein